MSDWKPIETAPMDGTVILVGHGYAVFDAYWREGEGWVDDCTNMFGDRETYLPTHWMPLPDPPKTSE